MEEKDNYMEALTQMELIELQQKQLEEEENSMEELWEVISTMGEDWKNTNEVRHPSGRTSVIDRPFKKILTDNLITYCKSKEQFDRVVYLEKILDQWDG